LAGAELFSSPSVSSTPDEINEKEKSIEEGVNKQIVMTV
jgi:hypothetical protein